MKLCPNKNTDYYRNLVTKHGDKAQMIWFNEEVLRLNEKDEKSIINNNKDKEFIDNLAKDNYLFTHVTTEANAKSITDNGIKISQGIGISSTLSVLDNKSVNSQIERLQNGEVVHRDLTNDSVAIIAIPKNLLDSIQGKDKAEKLEEWLVENDFANDGKYNIPTKFNIGYLGKEGLIQNNIVKSENNNKHVDLIAKTQIEEEILKEQVDNTEEDTLNYDNFGDIVVENSDKLFAKKSDVKIVKLKAKIPTLKQVRKAVSKLEANKVIQITTTDEQKRLYNIQRIDENGDFLPNDFFDIKLQNDIVDSVFSLAYQAVLSKPVKEREKLTEESLIDEAIENINDIYAVLYDIDVNNKEAIVIANTERLAKGEELTEEELEEVNLFGYMSYIDIYEDIYNTNEQVKKFTVQKFKNIKIDFRKLKDELDINDDETNDRNEYIKNEERNPKDTMSDRVKMFISTAIQYKYNPTTEQIEPVINKIGFNQIVDSSIYEKMLQMLSNKPNLSLDDMLRALRVSEVKQPTLYKLAEKIERRENRIKNELISAFKKANIKAYVTQYSKTGKDSYSVMTFEGNRSSYLAKIIDIWKEEQKISINNRTTEQKENSFVTMNNKGEIVINKINIENFYNRVQELNNNPESTSKDYEILAKELLFNIGIELSNEAFMDVINNEITLSKNYNRYNNTTLKGKFGYVEKDGFETQPDGLFSDILHILRGKSKFDVKDGDDIDSQIIVSNPLYRDTRAVSFLGELEAKYSDIITTTHTTVEGKKTYDYLLPTYQYSEYLKAKFDSDYKDELANDLFASHSFIFRNIINSEKGNDYTMGLFEAIKNEKSKKGVTRPSMSNRENIMSDFYNFINENKDYANYFDLTKSDKTTSPFHYKVPKITSKADAYEEYFQIFKAEYTRILNKDEIGTLSGQLNKGAGYFYLLPQFNYEMMVKLKEQNVITNEELKYIWEDKDNINSHIGNTLQDGENYTETFKNIIDKIIKDKVEHFKEEIDNKSIPILKGESTADESIEQYIYNKHIFNVGLAMFYSGDPASFYKGNSNNIIDNINTTSDTYTKRLAKDIAPGIAGNYDKPIYKAITITVPKTFSVEYADLNLDKFYGLKNGKGQIDSSDASQFCSVKRFFQILYDYGRVPDNIYNQIQKRTKVNDPLTKEQMQYIAPMKPVEVSRKATIIGNTKQTYSYIDYVKSSLIPLVPNLVNGTDMGKLMELIEIHEIDQVSLDTGAKSGNPVNMFQPFDINNKWIHDEANTNAIVDTIRDMKSEGFLIQQENPYDETKEEITFITQLNKLTLDTISTITDDIFNFKGKNLNGEQIALEKEEIRKRILDISFQELREEFGIDENGNINKQKLVEYILRTSDDLTINQKEELALKDNNFVIPLFFNRSSNQIQNKFGSLVRKAIQVKMNGKSFIQASSLGIGSIDMTGNTPNDIIRTNGWKGDKLRPLRPVIQEIHDSLKVEVYLTQEQLDKGAKGKQFELTKEQKEYLVKNHEEESEGLLTKPYSIKILPAEVLVPFNFFDKKGDRLDISNFIVDGKLQIDEEFLKFVGARIPNQSHSSQLPMKIVGFLPAFGGDIMYVPAEITKQMGSDFDIDKMYVYKKKYNTFKSSPLIDRFNEINKEIEKQKTILDNNKPTEEDFKNVNNALDEYHKLVDSDMFLQKVKDRVKDREDVDLTDERVKDFFDNLTFNQLESFKELTYRESQHTTSVRDKYKVRKIAELVIALKQEDRDTRRVVYHFHTNKFSKDIETKNKFKQAIANLKQLNAEKKELKEKIKEEPTNNISSNLELNKYGVEEKESYDEMKHLKNDYFDILHSILISPALFEKVMQPLDMDDIKDIVSKRNDNEKSELRDLFDPLNQLESYTSNVGVKALVGTFSLNLTFNTLLQRTQNVRLKQSKLLGDIVIGGIKLTTFSGLGRGQFKTINKNKVKTVADRNTSDNIIIPQTEALDHANNQIADKINLNDITVNAYNALTMLKSDDSKLAGIEYAAQLINNEVVKTYVSNLMANRDGFSDLAGKDEKKEAYYKTLVDLDISLGETGDKSKIKIGININLSDKALGIAKDKEGYIKTLVEPPKSKELLDAFIKLTEIGDEMFQFMIATNFDTKGFGTNLLEGLHKKNLVGKLSTETNYISGFSELLQNGEEQTELGKTTKLALQVLDSLANLFDYTILDGVMNKIMEIKGKDELRPKEIRTIVNNFQSFAFSAPVMWDNIEGERYRLLYSENNMSLRLDNLKLKYSEYTLFKKLETKTAKRLKDPNYITYRTNDIEQDAQYIYNEFFALANSDISELKEFMTDLIKYAYITGGISDYQSFVNLIPPSIIQNLLAQSMKEILVSRNFDEKAFVRQYFQHNPEEGTPSNVFNGSQNKYKKYTNDLTNNYILENPYGEEELERPQYIYMKGGNHEGQKKTFLYELIPNTLNYLQIDTLGDYNSNEYNYNANYVNSLIPVNQTFMGQHINNATSITSKINLTTGSLSEINRRKNESLERLIDRGRGNLTNSLLFIGQQINPYKELANILFLNTVQNGFPTADIIVTDNEDSYSGRVIRVSRNSDNMIEKLMHEALHHTTRHYLDNNNNIVTHKLKRVVNEVIDAMIKSGKITEERINEYIKVVEDYSGEEKMNRIDALDEHFELSAGDKLLYYYLSDVNEFVAGAFSDFNFQTDLNKIQSIKENENLFTTFKRWIERLMVEIAKNIGVEIEDGSALYATISTVVNNINTEYTESSEKIYFNENDIREGKELILNCK